LYQFGSFFVEIIFETELSNALRLAETECDAVNQMKFIHYT